MSNKLFYGDNLDVLREQIADESVDLIYLDPPFNSDANYNVLFKAPAGKRSEAQIEAFKDTWTWGEAAARAFDDVIRSRHTDVAVMLRAMRSILHESDLMAYLCMMAVRLIELRRVLKPTGSLYLHCDPLAGHYLKLVLDGIFGTEHFINEIIWRRTGAHSDAKQGSAHFGRVHDLIFFYSKDTGFRWHPLWRPHNEDYISSHYTNIDGNGRKFRWDNLTGPGGAAKGNPYYDVLGVMGHWRYSRERMAQLIADGYVAIPPSGKKPALKRYLDEQMGSPITDLWDDISPLNSQAQERLGYPTQKPLALLDRIIEASSNLDDLVLDPFCGCGTTVHSAQRLGRRWIGIDITHLAISLIERRLKDAFPGIKFEVEGTPKDFDGARDLAARDKYQFQWWAVSLVDAVPQGGARKKGADRGIDGIRWVRMGVREGDVEQVIVSVKGGENVGSAMVRDLKGTVEREGALAGLFITLVEPTRDMLREAATSGFFETSFGRFPKIQIFSVKMLLAGMKPELPPLGRGEGFRRAPRETGAKPTQGGLDV